MVILLKVTAESSVLATSGHELHQHLLEISVWKLSAEIQNTLESIQDLFTDENIQFRYGKVSHGKALHG